MNKQLVPRLTLWFCLVLALSSCTRAEQAKATQIAIAVATGVAATRSAEPTSTAYPTSTPRPTQAPLPTASRLPTQAPLASLTALPSATPYPTQIPWPTFTMTPSPTNTTVSLPVTAVAVPSSGSDDLETQLLGVLQAILNDMRAFRTLVNQGFTTGNVDCAAIIATYERVALAPTFSVEDASAEAQFAHEVYRQGILVFTGQSSDPFGGGALAAYDNCVNNGTNTTYSQKQNSDAGLATSHAEELLTQGIQRLGGNI